MRRLVGLCLLLAESDLLSCSLLQYIEYGTEESILVLQTCFEQLNICGKDLKNVHLEPVVASIFKYVLDKPTFSTVLCESLGNTAVNEDFLENLCNALQLAAPEKIGVGLALSDSENIDIRMCGMVHTIFCVDRLIWCKLLVLFFFPYIFVMFD